LAHDRRIMSANMDLVALSSTQLKSSSIIFSLTIVLSR
jgi:hypothetical protein